MFKSGQLPVTLAVATPHVPMKVPTAILWITHLLIIQEIALKPDVCQIDDDSRVRDHRECAVLLVQ